jgi:hypothetical protein
MNIERNILAGKEGFELLQEVSFFDHLASNWLENQ